MTTRRNGRTRPTATLAQVAGAERAKVVYSYDFGDDWRHDIVVEKIIRPSREWPTRAAPAGAGMGCRRTAGIWVFNEQFADFGDLFNVGDLNERLADLATVLIRPAEPGGGARSPDRSGRVLTAGEGPARKG